MLFLLLLAGFTFVVGKAQNHEIVYPRMVVSRSGEKRVLFRAFDQDFHLRLEPADAITDDLVLLTRDDKGEEVFMKPNVDNLRETVLQDPNVGATITVDDNGPLKIKGVINDNLRIEPDLGNYYKGGGEGTEQGREDPMEKIPHRVYEVDHRIKDPQFFDDEITPDELKYNLSEATTEERGDLIVIETAVVSDIRHSSRFKTDRDCIIYHLILINCVNLRFQTLKINNVRFVLVIVMRNSVPNDQPYIESNTVQGHALSSETLYAFSAFVSTHPTLSKADLCELITAQPLGDLDKSTNKINPGVIGIAFVGGACSSKYKCGISEDDGFTFSGCLTFAHENGHSLSCPHDQSPPAIQGSPGSEKCLWSWGMIMSYVSENEQQFAFSSCCDDCVSHFAKLRSTACLFRKDVSNGVSITDDRLPGGMLSELFKCPKEKSMFCFYDNKCKIMRDDWTIYQTFENKCLKSHRCRTPASKDGSFYYWELNSGAGEPCADGKVCKNGYCVAS